MYVAMVAAATHVQIRVLELDFGSEVAIDSKHLVKFRNWGVKVALDFYSV